VVKHFSQLQELVVMILENCTDHRHDDPENESTGILNSFGKIEEDIISGKIKGGLWEAWNIESKYGFESVVDAVDAALTEFRVHVVNFQDEVKKKDPLHRHGKSRHTSARR
jgi:hypothetical protein